jgi:streptomycin 6-kinase
MVHVARPVGAMHGDLHLGNVLYDPQTDRLTLLDPRGKFGWSPGKSGDALYDWAKLAHDMYFGYYALVANAAPNPISRKIFLEVAPKDDINIIIQGGLLLIATAIPLHYEDEARQERMRRLVIDNIHGLR